MHSNEIFDFKLIHFMQCMMVIDEKRNILKQIKILKT